MYTNILKKLFIIIIILKYTKNYVYYILLYKILYIYFPKDQDTVGFSLHSVQSAVKFLDKKYL